jgi:hypothetical protein
VLGERLPALSLFPGPSTRAGKGGVKEIIFHLAGNMGDTKLADHLGKEQEKRSFFISSAQDGFRTRDRKTGKKERPERGKYFPRGIPLD